MLGALITGVRRAFPYVAPEEIEPLVESSGEQLFKIVHKAPFTVGVQVSEKEGAREAEQRVISFLLHSPHKPYCCSCSISCPPALMADSPSPPPALPSPLPQALMLMFQLMSSRNSVPDRFYRAVYSVLLSDGPSTSSKAPMFLSLVFKVGVAGLHRQLRSPPRVLAVHQCLLSSAQKTDSGSVDLLKPPRPVQISEAFPSTHPSLPGDEVRREREARVGPG